jgi:hypothetical protein
VGEARCAAAGENCGNVEAVLARLGFEVDAGEGMPCFLLVGSAKNLMGLLTKLPETRVAGRSSSTVRKTGEPWWRSLGCQKTLWIALEAAGADAAGCVVWVWAAAVSVRAVKRTIERRCMRAGSTLV